MRAAALWRIAVGTGAGGALAWLLQAQAASLSPAHMAVLLGAGLGLSLVIPGEPTEAPGLVAALLALAASPLGQRYWSMHERSALERFVFLKTLLVVGALLLLARAYRRPRERAG